jgi:hypothetical protein
MSINRLFTFNQATFLVDLDKEWISTIKEFKALILRDKGTKGDTQARKKLQAQKEFTFIYHYCDYRSQLINYPEKERMVKALENAELDPKLDPYSDKELAAAIETYRVFQETPALKMLTELKEGIHLGQKVVKKIRQNLEAKLDDLDIDEVIVEQQGNKTVTVDPIKQIEARLTTIMELANKLPKTLESIEALEDKVKKELGEAPELRGKAELGTREEAPAINSGGTGGNPFNTLHKAS